MLVRHGAKSYCEGMKAEASSRTRLVLTAVAFGVCVTLLGLAVLAASWAWWTEEDEAPRPDTAAFLSEVRPHMTLTHWTDLTLIDAGTYVCDGLGEPGQSGSSTETLINEIVTAYQQQGYTEADLPRIQNDWAFIALAAAHELCPEWSDAMDEAFHSPR